MMVKSGCKESMDRKDDEEVMEREQDRTTKTIEQDDMDTDDFSFC